jgi:hypothetical protein
VWKQKKVWEGFIRCCQRTKPQSFAVMLQLPAPQLKSVFDTCPELREPLLDHVNKNELALSKSFCETRHRFDTVTFVGTCPKKDVYFNTFDPYLLCVLNGHYRVVHYSCGSLDCHFLFLISFQMCRNNMRITIIGLG